MGIPMWFNLEVTGLVEGMPAYATLVGQPQGQKMKSNRSLEKDIIKLKGNGRKIIIPLDPNEGKTWRESLDEDHEARCLYQIFN